MRESARQVLREHRLVLGIAGSYMAMVGVVQISSGRPWPVRLTTPLFAGVWITLSVLYLVLRHPGELRREVTLERVGGALLVGLLAVPVQVSFQSAKQSIGPLIGFRYDPLLARLDEALHGGAAWLLLAPVMSEAFVRILDLLYMLWFPMLMAFVVWCAWSPARAVRQRAIVALLLLWGAGGTLAAAVFASGGPCYYESIVGAHSEYQALLAQLDAMGNTLARMNQIGVWQNQERDVWQPFGGVSAMPSMHVGLSVLVALIAWTRSKITSLILAAYAVLIQIGSVALAWHYAIDGYAGALCAWLSWHAAGRICSREGDSCSQR